MKISIINGPNLNLTGNRETGIYGSVSFQEFIPKLRSMYAEVEIGFFQSNLEGELIDRIQHDGFYGNSEGIIINAGGYSHTSVAIADAIKACKVPVISVHISNIFSREPQRHTDLIASYSTGQITGLGLYGYSAALGYLLQLKELLP